MAGFHLIVHRCREHLQQILEYTGTLIYVPTAEAAVCMVSASRQVARQAVAQGELARQHGAAHLTRGAENGQAGLWEGWLEVLR